MNHTKATESLLIALEFFIRQTNEINKKYTPKEYRNKG